MAYFFAGSAMIGGTSFSGGLVFGGLITLVGCQMGLNATGGADGVGRATVGSFVRIAVLILVCDFLLWLILYPGRG